MSGGKEMDIEVGAEVFDKKGANLGKVDYVIRDTWSGEISKFIIYKPGDEADLAFTPEDVLESSDSRIELSVSANGSDKAEK